MIGLLDNCELKFEGGKCFDDAYLSIYEELTKIKSIKALDEFIEDFDSVIGPRLFISDGSLVYEVFEESFVKMKVSYSIEGFCGYSSKNVDLKYWH